MATAMKKSVQKIQNAIQATLENLESRVHLSAGQLDYSWYDHLTNTGTNGSYGYLNEVSSNNLVLMQPYVLKNPAAPAKELAGPDYDISNSVATGTGTSATTIDNQIIKTLIDNAGNTYVIGYTVGYIGYQAEWTERVVTDPTTNPPTTQDQARTFYGSIEHRQVYIARYLPNGQLDTNYAIPLNYSSQYLVNGGNTFDFGNLPAPFYTSTGAATTAMDTVVQNHQFSITSTPNISQLFNDDAVTAAIDPTDGSIVVILKQTNTANGNNLWYMARYSPVSAVCTMTQIDFGMATASQGTVRDMKMLADGSFVLVGDSTPWANTISGEDVVARRYSRAGAILTDYATSVPAGTFTSYSADSFAGVDVGTVNGTSYVYVVGTSDDRTWNPGTGYERLIVERFNLITGAFDSNFGGGVQAELADFGGKNVEGVDIKVQSDGRIDVMGNVDQVADSAGTVDTTVVARLLTTGHLDATFIGGGRAYINPVTSSPADTWIGQEIALQSDGGIIVSGVDTTGGNSTLEVQRLDLTGRVDTSFGFSGVGQFPPATTNTADGSFLAALGLEQSASSLTINRGPSGNGDDKVVIGFDPVDANPYFAIARELTKNTPPTANLQAPDVYTVSPTYNFTITFSDDELVSRKSLQNLANSGALSIIQPNGTLLSGLTFTITGITVITDPSVDRDGDTFNDAHTFSVRMSVNVGAAGGFQQNGLYTIKLAGGVVSDSNTTLSGTQAAPVNTAAPAFMATRTLGGFVVNIATPDTTAPSISYDYSQTDTGHATGGTATTLVNTNAQWLTDWTGATVTIIDGTGVGTVLTVTGMGRSAANANATFCDTLIFGSNIGFIPDATTEYKIAFTGKNDIRDGLTVRGRAYFDINVVYTDLQSGVDVNSLLSSNITVTGPRGYVASAANGNLRLLSLSHLNNDYIIQVTYRIWAPNAVADNDYAHPWNSTFNGIYTVSMGANQVKDKAAYPNVIGAGQIAQFNVAIDDANTVYPTVTLIGVTPDDKPALPGTQITASRASIGIDVKYSKSPYSYGFIDPNSQFDQAIYVTNSLGFSQVAKLGSYTRNADGSYNVHYTLSPLSDGSWDVADNATYTIHQLAGTVKDTETPVNFIQQNDNIGTFDVVIVPGQDARPTVSSLVVTPDEDAVTPNSQILDVRQYVTLTVTYQTSTFGVGPISSTLAQLQAAIQVLGPGGVQMTVQQFGSVVTAGNQTTVTYKVSAPDGQWDPADSGTYQIALQPNTIQDSSVPANVANAANVGSFTVNIAGNASSDRPTGAATVPNINVVQGAVTFTVKFKANFPGAVIDGANSDFANAIASVTGTSSVVVSYVAGSAVNNGDGTWSATYSMHTADGGGARGVHPIPARTRSTWRPVRSSIMRLRPNRTRPGQPARSV